MAELQEYLTHIGVIHTIPPDQVEPYYAHLKQLEAKLPDAEKHDFALFKLA